MEEPPPPTVELPLAFVTILETYKVFNEIHDVFFIQVL